MLVIGIPEEPILLEVLTDLFVLFTLYLIPAKHFFKSILYWSRLKENAILLVAPVLKICNYLAIYLQ